jgi:hypothetical protein
LPEPGKQKFFDLCIDGERADERHGVAKRQYTHRVVISVRVGQASLAHERREYLIITAAKDRHAQGEPRGRQRKAAAVIGKQPIDAHDGEPEDMDHEPHGVAWPLPHWILYQVFEPLNQIDAALGFAFLDIEVTFEIVVLCLFRDFSNGAQSIWDFGFGSPMEFARRNKTNMGASEVDLGGIIHVVEIWRRVESRTGKIGGLIKRPVRKIGFLIKPRVLERYDRETGGAGARLLVQLFEC